MYTTVHYSTYGTKPVLPSSTLVIPQQARNVARNVLRETRVSRKLPKRRACSEVVVNYHYPSPKEDSFDSIRPSAHTRGRTSSSSAGYSVACRVRHTSCPGTSSRHRGLKPFVERPETPRLSVAIQRSRTKPLLPSPVILGLSRKLLVAVVPPY